MKFIKIFFLSIVVSFASCGINSSSTDDLATIDSLSTILSDRESEIENHLQQPTHRVSCLRTTSR